MIPSLDIFRVAADGRLIWRTTADSLQSAHRRIKILMASEPSDYVVYDQETGAKTLVRRDVGDRNDQSAPSPSD